MPDVRDQLQRSLGGSYRIDRELGGGGMSYVYAATDERLGREVVIKVLSPDVSAGVSVERFTREMKLVANLQHPHIVPLLSAGEAQGLPFFVMPLVPGRSLRERMREGPVPLAEAEKILGDVATALEHAHGKGVVHRDIKPENILLNGRTAIVADFGIAKAVQAARTEGDASTLTRAGDSLGTPAYMAPEQVTADNADERTDIYAWGVIAYELLSGVHPFAGKSTAREMMAAHVMEAPPPLRVNEPGAGDFIRLVTRCLEKDPAGRPQSARELLDGGVASRRGIAPRRLARWGVAGAVLVLLVGLAAYTAIRQGASEPAGLPSLAVLPLENASSDSAEAYFAHGMTDDITLALQRIPGLEVASRTSVGALVRAGAPPDEIGRRLGVTRLLAGSVRRDGPSLRVSAELIDLAQGGRVIWSDRFERAATGVFDVQDELAGSIVAAVAPALSARAAAERQEVAGTVHAAAYDHYLRGRYYLARRGRDPIRSAVAEFERAIALDPSFARAHAELSQALRLRSTYDDEPYAPIVPRALALARRALDLAPNSAEALTAMGSAANIANDVDGAERFLRRAISADPRYVQAYISLGEFLLRHGRSEEASGVLAGAVRVEPFMSLAHAEHGAALLSVRRFPDAVNAGRRALELDPQSALGRGVLALAYLELGHPDSTLALLRGAPPPMSSVLGTVYAAYARAGQQSQAESALVRLREMARMSPSKRVASYRGLAWAYAGAGDTARAIAAVRDWVASGDPVALGPIGFALPLFDSIRSHPEFPALLRRARIRPERLVRQ